MPEFPDRERMEVEFGKKFGAVARRHMREFRRLLGEPPSLKNVPQSFWDKVEDEADREFFPIFLLLFNESFALHGWDGAEAQLTAYGLAVGSSSRFGKYWSDSTRAVITQKFDKLKPEPVDPGFETDASVAEHRRRNRENPFQRTGEPPDVPPGSRARLPRTVGEPSEPSVDEIPELEVPQEVGRKTPIQTEPDIEPEPEISDEELDRLVDDAFGVHRIDRIVSDETTRTRFQGGEIAIGNTVGISADDLWHCDFLHSNVCGICAPNHLTTRREWGARYPNGAPIHPRCACWIDYANRL